MTSLVFPDALLDLRYWLRNHSLLSSLTAQRVFFSIPAKPSGSPFMRIYRVGGGPQASEAPKQDLRISHDIWALLDEDYTLVRQTTQALESLYQQADNELMNGSTVLEYALVSGVTDSPDPDTGWPRQVLTVAMTVSLP